MSPGRPDALLGELRGRRWFAADSEALSARPAAVVHADRDLELLLVDVEFEDVPARTYLLARTADGRDALTDRAALHRLTSLAGVDTPCASVRVAGGEQSNSAVVLDEAVVLKLYRQVEHGPGVEAELLRALGGAGFAATPELLGTIECGPEATTLAIVTRLVPTAGDGWELTLASVRNDDPDWLPERARQLGETTGSLHAALAGASALDTAAPASGAIDAFAADLDRELDALAGASGHGVPVEALRALLAHLAAEARPPALLGRIHGDYHLGQVLWSEAATWAVIDLEGEPRRPLAERRLPAVALRDVAGMLRSFAYAADGSELLVGVPVPAGWEEECRSAFLDGWLGAVDPRLVPPSVAATEAVVRLCELQKALYELRYELAHRPEWASIPARGLERMLVAA